MNMKIHTKGIKGSGMIKEGENPSVMFSAILEIDGVLIDEVTRVRVLHGADEITTVMVRMFPGTLDTIAHTDTSWKELIERLDAQVAV